MSENALSQSIPADALCGPEGQGNVEDCKRFAIDGREPQQVVYPESVEQVSALLRAAGEKHLAVAPVGYGAFLSLGYPPRQYDVALSLQRLNRIVDYQPTDMTVTVEAGITLAQLQMVLGENGQWLPVDPPLPERATIGGIIAANLSGPARLSQGTIRDFLIGIKVVQADGTIAKGGGRVVKNVAGYDLPKLYCGSFGTLGVIVEATFKVRPRPEAQAVFSLSFPSADKTMEFVQRVLSSELQPLFLEWTNFQPAQKLAVERGVHYLFAAFAGVVEEVEYQRTRIHEISGDGNSKIEACEESEARIVVENLRDFAVVGRGTLCCKVSVLPTRMTTFCETIEEEAALRGLSAQLLAHAGNGIVYSRFAQHEEVSAAQTLSLVDWLRILAKKVDGYMVVEAIDSILKDRVDVWGHVGTAFPLMKRLKETLDPNGILNPGRFVGRL
jgi:glycolate oxidase FAD binding subunit